MGLPSARSRKPRASEVVTWCKSRVGKRLDVDGYWGSQCWDLPNYLFKRYWGFTTTGNAIAMGWYNYPKGFKKFKNTPSFVPKPGDIAVWGTGSFNNGVGHTGMVVGPSNTKTFRGVDQNWFNANSYHGSPASYVTHNYNGISYFIRPPWHAEKKEHVEPTKPSKEQEKAEHKQGKVTKKQPKYIEKEQKKIKYTSFDDDLEIIQRNITQYIDDSSVNRGKEPIGVYIKENNDFRSAAEIYRNRNVYVPPVDYPHFYVDRNFRWQCRHTSEKIKGHENYIVIEVCGSNTDDKSDFVMNTVSAMTKAYEALSWSNIKFSKDIIHADRNIWRTIKDVTGYDMIKKGFPDQETYEKVKVKLVDYYENAKEYYTEKIATATTKTKIKVKNPKANENTTINNTSKPSSSSSSSSSSSKPSTSSSKPKTTISKSGYTFTAALNKQMRTNPQWSNGWGWVSASRTQTSNAMNPTTIWNSSTQKYQMLNLGKYQGVSVKNLNKILKGKGTLNNQGKAFAKACKKYNINEIYLISHAFLESGNGRSNYASGRYGIYNYFGIGAYDYNPDYAITFARNRGWTSPAKGIMGGAAFVKKDFISVGQNTLYRMRWNPKHPATHQYATDVRWAQHQASNISALYKKIGISGQYYVRDKYK